MNLPPDATMLFLLSVYCGEPVGVSGDEIRVELDARIGGLTSVTVPDADLAELEDRGWLEIDEQGPKLTERGRYWLSRWAKAKTRRKGT